MKENTSDSEEELEFNSKPKDLNDRINRLLKMWRYKKEGEIEEANKKAHDNGEAELDPPSGSDEEEEDPKQ